MEARNLRSPNRLSADVAIIGGGITGCAAAWFLASAGADAVLIETGELNAAASGSNAGSLHGQIPQDTFLELGETWAASFAPTLQLLQASIGLWKAADEAFGGALEVRVNGGLMLASSPEDMRRIARKAVFERAAGVHCELLDDAELRRLAPYLSGELAGAGLCRQEGKANPLVAAPTFARHAQALGARILRGQPLREIAVAAGGHRLETRDHRITAGRVVIAAGAGTAAIPGLDDLGRLPIQSVPIQVSVTEPLVPTIEPLLYYARAPLTMKQTGAGTVVIGGGWPARLDARQRPIPDPNSLAQNLALALEVMPALRDINVIRTWAASVNGTPDWKPLIGELPGAAGVYLAYVPWMGFTGGPAAARVATNLALDLPINAGLAVDTPALRSFAPGTPG